MQRVAIETPTPISTMLIKKGGQKRNEKEMNKQPTKCGKSIY